TSGWTLFVLFFVSVALLAVGIPKIVFSFKEDGGFKVENTYPVVGKKATLRINEVGMDDYRVTRLTLVGHEGKEIRLVQEFEAQGTTRAKAIENARMVEYTVDVRDSVFTFDNNIQFTPDAVFRAQRLDMRMYIPYNFPFTMDEGVARLLTEYVGWEHRDGETWKLTQERGLECITCPAPEASEDDDGDGENWGETLSNFDEVEITGKFDVRIRNGHDYNVELIGPDREKAKYNIYRSGSTLVIDYEGKNVNWGLKNLNIDDMRINITMPALRKLEATGMGSIRFDNFHLDDMEIESRGPVNIRGEISTRRLTLTLNGKSELELSGNADNLDARLELASKLRAYSLNVTEAIVEVSGGSSAKVNVSGNLEIEEGVASEVDYRGSPNVVKRD
ncbi:MAG TPA: head GIN domain-containing protein, partial [Chryseosolibacter sp.]|nr:head GIN domain-containing protein [Chryseosolibacter sp.]